MTDEILTHKPTRSATKYVSEAFSFLNSEDTNDAFDESANTDIVNIDQASGINEQFANLEENDVRKYTPENEMRPEKITFDETSVSRDEKHCAKMSEQVGNIDGEFSILTVVGNDDKFSPNTKKETHDFVTDGKGLIEINPVYEVSNDFEQMNNTDDINQENGIDEADQNNMIDRLTNTKTDCEDDKKELDDVSIYFTKSRTDSEPHNNISNATRAGVRQSSTFTVDGEVVELRKSLDEIKTKQVRKPTWKMNQQVVSEVFGFLKQIDVDESRDTDQLNGLNSCSLDDQPSLFDSSENDERPATSSQCYSEQSDFESVNTELDYICELPASRPGVTRGKKIKHQYGTGDDDGNSSDEDKGIYRESFRKSTWLYIGDNEEIKDSKNQANYISLSDLGVNTCDNDSVFGEGDLVHSPISELASNRNDSTATTLSEQEFRNKYNAVSRRIVKRADSQQEYKRHTAKYLDNVKTFNLERDSSTEFGIHILDSKPAIISGIDTDSAAQTAGLKEGQILISVNGINVLEADHKDIIGLVHRDSKTLTLEVGSGDTSTVLDLQIPVMTGYLQKHVSSTIFKLWKKRFFILRRDNCLYYYKNETETDPLGAIPLNGYTVSRHGDLSKFGFKAEKYNHKTLYFQADNREQMARWVGALNDAVQKGRSKDSWMDVTAQNVGLPALSIRNPDCTGYMFKMGRATRRWRKRYCVLKDACIYYYRNANSKDADGVAHLHGYSVDGNCVAGKKFSFSLRPPEPQMRTFCFYTDNDTDKLRWIRSLNASIKKWVKVD